MTATMIIAAVAATGCAAIATHFMWRIWKTARDERRTGRNVLVYGMADGREITLPNGYSLGFSALHSDPPSAEEFAHAFRVELRLGCEFHDYLNGVMLKRHGKDGGLDFKHADLRGFDELRGSEVVKALLENIQGRVAVEFERHLLNAYLDEPGIYYADTRARWGDLPVSKPAFHATGGHADAGAVADHVDEKRGEADGERDDSDNG